MMPSVRGRELKLMEDGVAGMLDDDALCARARIETMGTSNALALVIGCPLCEGEN